MKINFDSRTVLGPNLVLNATLASLKVSSLLFHLWQRIDVLRIKLFLDLDFDLVGEGLVCCSSLILFPVLDDSFIFFASSYSKGTI